LILRIAKAIALRLRAWRRYLSAFQQFRRAARSDERFGDIAWSDRHPCLYDATTNTGFDRHYVYHTAWAARVVLARPPAVHVDIGSSLYFVGIVSAATPVAFYDFRPASLGLDGLDSAAADLCALHFADDSIASLSCLHVLEHVGLGRYGDPIDPTGDVLAASELRRALAPGGSLLIVVPVGQPRVQFNAHRVYGYEQVLELFHGLALEEFALIPDDEAQGGLLRHAAPTLVATQNYACGCFHFRKPLTPPPATAPATRG